MRVCARACALGWGYGAFVTVEQAQDVMSFHTLRYIVNAGPRVLGPEPATGCQQNPSVERCRGNFTWAPGRILFCLRFYL